MGRYRERDPCSRRLSVLVVGLILLAAAVAVALVLVVQNRGTPVDVHAAGHTWAVHPYSIVLAGLAIGFVGLLGLTMMRAGAGRVHRLRRERAELLAENERLSNALADPTASSFFDDDVVFDGDASQARSAHGRATRSRFSRRHPAV
jgi:uncharacterized integral membrane protein